MKTFYSDHGVPFWHCISNYASNFENSSAVQSCISQQCHYMIMLHYISLWISIMHDPATWQWIQGTSFNCRKITDQLTIFKSSYARHSGSEQHCKIHDLWINATAMSEVLFYFTGQMCSYEMHLYYNTTDLSFTLWRLCILLSDKWRPICSECWWTHRMFPAWRCSGVFVILVSNTKPLNYLLTYCIHVGNRKWF